MKTISLNKCVSTVFWTINHHADLILTVDSSFGHRNTSKKLPYVHKVGLRKFCPEQLTSINQFF